jgi:tetratricopeptide (TPR) repeat protein/tRNA A-37 threonylcarbamoyl transferase component Bud32
LTFSRDHKDQEQLVDYVRQALACMDAGGQVDPVVLCAAHPHLVRPLAEVLGLAADLPILQQVALREDPLAGLVLAGRYRLEECLGRGAMGVVYRAEDQELRRAVAVKILDARLFRDPQAEQRFQREGEALAALQHPGVVAVYDRGRTAEGIHFLVMELLTGATLASVLDRIEGGAEPFAVLAEICPGGVPESHWPRLGARWALELARGLAAAHAHGLVHRDVKPSNAFVRADGRLVLLDFGIAARSDDQRLTATQTTLGTPWYMAPEQVRAGGLTTAEPTLDVYGLGALLYHLLAGRPPYEGDAATVLAALQTSDPIPLGKRAPELPRDLRAIVEQCLERDLARRYATAQALANDLEAFLQHRPVTARPLSAFGRRWRAWRRAPSKPIAVLALLLTALVLVIAVPIYRSQQEQARLRERDQLYATLPSVLAVEGWPDERVLAELRGEHLAALGLLDHILELGDDLPVRLWRACLRLDLGDRAAAAEDLRGIARRGGAYLGALAQRYLDADPQQQGAYAIDTAGLPEPTTAAECYVAGFHELRARHVRGFAQRADALLARAAGEYLPARDLRLLSVAALAEQSAKAQQRPLLQFLYDETVALEAIYGGETARTQAMRGVALLMQQNYPECVPCFERSLQLRPERHGPHQNLGIALLRLGDLDASEEHLMAALRLRPFAWNTQYTLAQLEQARGNFAKAREWALQVPKEGHSGQAWKRPNLLGSIAVDESLALHRSDPAASRAAAADAVLAYDAACAASPKSSALARRRGFAKALQQDDLPTAFVEYAKFLVDDLDPETVDDAYQLRNLAFLLPAKGLDEARAAWVAALLRRLGLVRAGGNERLKAQLRMDIEEGLQRFR